MFEPILHKTGPDAGCAPRFFFIAKDVSNIFSNNIEGRSNCKRDFVVDPALQCFNEKYHGGDGNPFAFEVYIVCNTSKSDDSK